MSYEFLIIVVACPMKKWASLVVNLIVSVLKESFDCVSLMLIQWIMTRKEIPKNEEVIPFQSGQLKWNIAVLILRF